MGFFSVDWEDFSLRLRVEAAPRVPIANSPRRELGSGTETCLVTKFRELAINSAPSVLLTHKSDRASLDGG